MSLQSLGFFIAAGVVLTVSIKARYWLGKDRFNRTTPAGLLQYNSYDEALVHRFVGWIVRVASGFGILLGFGWIVLAFMKL